MDYTNTTVNYVDYVDDEHVLTLTDDDLYKFDVRITEKQLVTRIEFGGHIVIEQDITEEQPVLHSYLLGWLDHYLKSPEGDWYRKLVEEMIEQTLGAPTEEHTDP
jgi:hypothetical protein